MRHVGPALFMVVWFPISLVFAFLTTMFIFPMIFFNPKRVLELWAYIITLPINDFKEESE
jgi:hypothetical protein